MAEEKWFEFVARMKTEHKFGSLAEAMKHASKNKHLWKKDSAAPATVEKKGKGKTRKNKTGSRRKM